MNYQIRWSRNFAAFKTDYFSLESLSSFASSLDSPISNDKLAPIIVSQLLKLDLMATPEGSELTSKRKAFYDAMTSLEWQCLGLLITLLGSVFMATGIICLIMEQTSIQWPVPMVGFSLYMLFAWRQIKLLASTQSLAHICRQATRLLNPINDEQASLLRFYQESDKAESESLKRYLTPTIGQRKIVRAEFLLWNSLFLKSAT